MRLILNAQEWMDSRGSGLSVRVAIKELPQKNRLERLILFHSVVEIGFSRFIQTSSLQDYGSTLYVLYFLRFISIVTVLLGFRL